MAGNAFFLSMLVMAAGAALIAYLMPVMLSVVGSVLTLYLVATAWAMVAHGTGRQGWFEVGALVVALALGVGSLMWGFEAINSETGLKDGFPAPPYFILGSVALLRAAGDFPLILPRGVRGGDAHRAAPLAHVLRALHCLVRVLPGPGPAVPGSDSPDAGAVDPGLSAALLAGVLGGSRAVHRLVWEIGS